MSQNLAFLDDEGLTDNLTDEVAKKFLNWLEHLSLSNSPVFDQMLAFTKAFNSAKKAPLSHRGKLLNNIFEIILVNSQPDSNMLIRYAIDLIEKGAVNVPQKEQKEA